MSDELTPEEERALKNGWQVGVEWERELLTRRLRKYTHRIEGGTLVLHLDWNDVRKIINGEKP